MGHLFLLGFGGIGVTLRKWDNGVGIGETGPRGKIVRFDHFEPGESDQEASGHVQLADIGSDAR